MDCKMWERLLGKEIYAEIEPASCEALKEKLYRQCSKALLRIYEAADRHYAGGL